jgi:hypothetical protein
MGLSGTKILFPRSVMALPSFGGISFTFVAMIAALSASEIQSGSNQNSRSAVW